MEKLNKKTKSVICIESGKIYPSIAEASRDTGVAASGISACCIKQRKTAGHYHWAYFSDGGGKSLMHAKVAKPLRGKVLCVETGEVFANAAEASRLTDISDCGIRRCCQGDQQTSGGYHWQRIAESEG